MEDLVALKATLENGRVAFLLTWGRTFDPVDATELVSTVEAHLDQFRLDAPAVSLDLCQSLGDARRAPYFFEGLFHFAQQMIPRGPEYDGWAAARREEIRAGRGVYFAGVCDQAN